MLIHKILVIDFNDIIFASSGKRRDADVIMKGILRRIPTILDDLYEVLLLKRYEPGYSKRYLNICYSMNIGNTTDLMIHLDYLEKKIGKESIKAEIYFIMYKIIKRYLRFKKPKAGLIPYVINYLFFGFRDYLIVTTRYLKRWDNLIIDNMDNYPDKEDGIDGIYTYDLPANLQYLYYLLQYNRIKDISNILYMSKYEIRKEIEQLKEAIYE